MGDERISRTSVVALAGASLLTLARPLAASAHGAKSGTYVYDCSTPSQRPGKTFLTCADANTDVSNITWSNWSGNTALASGTFKWNTGTTTCAAGIFTSKAINFSATRRRQVKGVWLYGDLKASKGTWSTGSGNYSLPTSAL